MGFIRQLRGTEIRSRQLPVWLDLPRADHVLPVLVGVAVALALFFLQKDLGPALLLSLIFVSMFASRAGVGWPRSRGSVMLVGGVSVIGHIAQRVEHAGRACRDVAVAVGQRRARRRSSGAGAWSMAAGAIEGHRPRSGRHTRFVPAGHTDLVLAAIGEELGAIGRTVIVGTVVALMAWRGLTHRQRPASTDYGVFPRDGDDAVVAVPVAVMAAGILGMMPLTGVVTPFLSYGGSAMVANFIALGLLAAISSDRRPAADLAPFTIPTRWLGRVALTAAASLVIVAASVQAARRRGPAVRPQLGMQADGGRRFQYNPRVLAAVAAIPRGGIFDRRGQPLAEACAGSSARCYPGGPAFFHVLGDANTRANWSAANSSYVERDAEALLRGFDDRATTITTTDRDGRTVAAIRRDYSAIVPLVRHRFEPDHPAVQAILTRPRDVRITIDAELQHAAASILAKTAKTAGAGRGAPLFSTPTPGRCSPASAIRGLRRRQECGLTSCSIARVTVCIPPDRRSR